MDTWIKNKIWEALAPFIIIVMAIAVGVVFNILTGTNEWDNFLVTLFQNAIKFVKEFSLW